MPVRVGRVLIRTSDMTTNTSVHSVDESCTSPFYLLLIELLTLVVLLVFGGGVVRAEWLQSLSSIKTDFRCIKMMISFNDTILND